MGTARVCAVPWSLWVHAALGLHTRWTIVSKCDITRIDEASAADMRAQAGTHPAVGQSCRRQCKWNGAEAVSTWKSKHAQPGESRSVRQHG